MITNTGKNILAKYLIGQAPAYASYIAVGCGANPVASDGVLGDYSNKTTLDFEMFRVPIISRGYVNDNGVSKIVLTGELPTTDRYEISEVGIFSGGSNPSAASYDSRLVYSFTQNENWEYHVADSGSTAIPEIYEPLDGDEQNNIISVTEPVFQTNADNRIFSDIQRSARYERCRFLNNTILMVGDDSDLSLSAGHIVVNSGNHIHLTGANIDFAKNAPTDEIRIAFSIVNKDGESVEVPDNVKILFEAASTDVHNEAGSQWARFEVDIDDVNFVAGTATIEEDFSTNRYFVVSKQFQELYTSTGFTWQTVDVVKAYVCVTKDGVPSSDYYVALDAIRMENVTTSNPLYGLTGYSVIKNINAETFIKPGNSTNFIEFRFAVDVVDPTGGTS